MSATQTVVVDLDRLQSQGADGNLVVRLMRAADDIAVANLGLRHFKDPRPRLEQHVQTGACRYFIRLQCGHLHEAMCLIEEFRTRPRLGDTLARCTVVARAAFTRVAECVPGGSRRGEFDALVAPIRNRLAFHYDPSLFEKALVRRQDRRSTITRGTDISLWRFGVADDLEDTIVCRLLWKIHASADLRVEADARVEFGANLCRDFLDFVGDFAFRYVRESAAG